MAKKITDTESSAVETHDTAPEQIEQPAQADETPKADEEAPAPKAEKKQKTEPAGQVEQDIPEYADRILRSFTNYPQLYIDFQGGTFTVDTPPAFRSNATLYTNPYYNKP